jgi:hypothetical protein
MPLPNDHGVPIKSEMIEPTCGLILGRLFARCEAVKGDRHAFEDACQSLWMASEAMCTIGVAISTAIHFSVAAGNHNIEFARYIRENLGIDPFKEWRRR